MSGFNPNATEWKPSAAAPSWTPGGGFTSTTAAATPAPVQSTSSVSSSSDNIDESDPLWQVVLKIAEGDKEKASKMISDPDSLMKYPEVEAFLSSQENGEEDWEKQPDDAAMATVEEDLATNVKESMKIEEEKPTPTADQPDTNMEEEEEDSAPVELEDVDPREHFNLVFIGHVDAGKSTLSGNILYLTDNVDKRTIERYEREAKNLNRDSWFLAFIMDTNEEERAKGKTVEVGRATFSTDVKRYTIMDAPGHKNYVPNMIMGASQADIAILVISARKGEFETGFDRGGQTREHAMLAKTLGVSHLIVVINKMDEPTVGWAKSRFDECVNKLRPFLKGCGFVIKKEVKFLPISGLGGANIKDEVDPKVCPWWKPMYQSGENNTTSPTLLGLLDSLEIKGRNENAPLRIPVLDRYTDRGTIAMGKVESGTLKPGMKVTVMPTRSTYKVDSIWADEKPINQALPGENILVKLSGCSTDDILRGYVICTPPTCRSVQKIICQIGLVDMPENCKIFSAGFQAMFHAHTCEEECTVVKVFETTSNKGVVTKNAPFATVGMKAICMIEVTRTICVETYDDFPFLGRFTLRTEGKTIAIGKITKLPPKKE